MAVIHNTTMRPSKLELLSRWLPEQAWYPGSADQLRRAGGFRLDDPDGEVGIEFMIVVTTNDRAYLVPMTYRGAPLDGAEHALIGTSEHGVLGTRWIYDGEHDPVLWAQLVALLRGEVVAQAQDESDTPDSTVRVQAATSTAVVQLNRALHPADASPGNGGYVTATWRRLDGSPMRGIVATAQ
jgi:Maltokinase N-terminal cap domain